MPLNITDGATVTKPNGVDFLDEYAGHVKTLYETGSRPLTSIGGTGDVVTATMAVDLTDAGLVDGLCVSLTWAAANTGSVTLAINGGSPIPVVDAAGDALTPDTLTADLTSVLRYTAGEWRIISSLGVTGGGSGPSYEILTASQTWNKPTGYADDAMVRIQLWGGGGGGGRGARGIANTGAGGGGGGGYIEQWMRIADIPTSVLITIGSGGAGQTGASGSGASGGNTTFGSLLTAYGGGGGGGQNTGAAAASGGGGGELTAGGNASLATPGTGGAIGGAVGTISAGLSALTIFGGGSGGGNGIGGSAVFGGGGGGGSQNAVIAGGNSVFGGAGGASNFGATSGSPGVAPGGGGGGCGSGAAATGAGVGGNGARGECRITIFG